MAQTFRLAVLSIGLVLGACSAFDRDGGARGTTAPVILPLDQLIAAAGETRLPLSTGEDLAARAARLRAKGAAMRARPTPLPPMATPAG